MVSKPSGQISSGGVVESVVDVVVAVVVVVESLGVVEVEVVGGVVLSDHVVDVCVVVTSVNNNVKQGF